MKKSLLALLICICIIASLTACGGTSSSSSEGEQQAIADNSEQGNSDNTINFDTPLLAVDDENVTVEILSLSEQSYNYDKESDEYGFIQYNINCRVTNKSADYYVDSSIPNGYASVGSHTVDFASGDAHTRPGKTNDGVYFCATRYNDGSGDSRGVEYIEKLEDLLEFDADLSITLYTDTDTANEVSKEYKVPVSIPELTSAQK